MPFRLFRMLIDFPALDRLLDYLQGAQQAEIDAATAQVNSITARFKTSGDALAIKEKQNARPH